MSAIAFATICDGCRRLERAGWEQTATERDRGILFTRITIYGTERYWYSEQTANELEERLTEVI